MRPTSLILAAALVSATAPGCSLITVQQDPFPIMEIKADRPEAPPARVVLTPSSIQIADKVQFAFNSAELLPVSFSLLDEVAKMLKDNPQIEQLQVEGHTDSTGTAARNRTLSQQRAESVRTYLVKQGIEKKRLSAKGFGPERPIAGNDTPEGQEANRRVEFNILKQGPKKVLVQDE